MLEVLQGLLSHSLIHTFTDILSLSHTHSHAHTLILSCSLIDLRRIAHSFVHTHTHTHSLTHSYTLRYIA
uniref:Uncharacterized protein n=1 Tax=Anguilla anguilla TaxID=7936 RepID=A0A0E9WN30_ANGAN